MSCMWYGGGGGEGGNHLSSVQTEGETVFPCNENQLDYNIYHPIRQQSITHCHENFKSHSSNHF